MATFPVRSRGRYCPGARQAERLLPLGSGLYIHKHVQTIVINYLTINTYNHLILEHYFIILKLGVQCGICLLRQGLSVMAFYPGCSGTFYVDQTDLALTEIPLSLALPPKSWD